MRFQCSIKRSWQSFLVWKIYPNNLLSDSTTFKAFSDRIVDIVSRRRLLHYPPPIQNLQLKNGRSSFLYPRAPPPPPTSNQQPLYMWWIETEPAVRLYEFCGQIHTFLHKGVKPRRPKSALYISGI